MNHETSNPESPDPLHVALQLEQASESTQGVPERSSALAEVPESLDADEFYQAMAGLDLIRRAARHERQSQLLNGLDTTTKEHGETLSAMVNPSDAPPSASRSDGPREQLSQPGNDYRIGRFEILQELGRGGFGVVLLGRDPQLDRLVAIKVLKSDAMLDRDARQRFAREARLGSLLSHPSIVPIFEFQANGFINYIAFEYCRGRSLAEWMQQQGRTIAPATSARIVAQLAQAVQYAHQRGVIHRDLKPSNVLLDLEDGISQDVSEIVSSLRITDFGLAKSVTPSDGHVTRDGAIVGTPAYMAPEQASGKLESVGEAADIYALGVILYELLAGRPPFLKPTDLATLRAVEKDPPPELRRLRNEIPCDLEAICMKCLEKHSSQRYASAYELESDLERFLAHAPVHARKITSLEKAWRWARRNPAWSSAMVILMIGLAGTTWQWRRAEHHWKQANHFLEQSQAQSNRAERNLSQTEKAIDRMLNEVADALKHVPQMEPLRTRMLQQALEIQQQLVVDQAEDPEVRIRTVASHRRMGEIWLALGSLDQARSAVDLARNELRQIQPWVEKLSWLDEHGRLSSLMGDIDLAQDDAVSAEKAASDAVRTWQSINEHHPSPENQHAWIIALRREGMALELQSKFPESQRSLEFALSLVQAVPTPERGDETEILHGQLLNSLGVLHSRMGQADVSESYYLQAIETLRPVVKRRPDRIDLGYSLAITSFNLGNRFSRLREHAQAVVHYEFAYELLDRLETSFPSNVAYRKNRIRVASGWGLSAFRMGEPQKGAALLERALIAQQGLPDSIRETPKSREDQALMLLNLGNICHEGLDDTEKALEHYREALKIREELSQQSPHSSEILRGISICKGNIAACALKLGDLVPARQGFAEALELAETVCQMDRNDQMAQRNAAFQLNKLAETHMQLQDVNALLQSVIRYVDAERDSPQRRLQAVRTLALCIQRYQGDARIDPSSETAGEEETLRTAALEFVKQLIDQGASLQPLLAEQKTLGPLLQDQRFQQLIQGASTIASPNPTR